MHQKLESNTFWYVLIFFMLRPSSAIDSLVRLNSFDTQSSQVKIERFDFNVSTSHFFFMNATQGADEKVRSDYKSK